MTRRAQRPPMLSLARHTGRRAGARIGRPYVRPPQHGIPAQPTPLIGREHEVQLVREQLARPEVRLLTLTGPAGTGKTRLALQAAVEWAPGVRDGAVLVNLAPISDARLVTWEIARALGIREERGGLRLLDSLKSALREKELLLVLDNFEQVLGAAAHVADLLSACPELKVLSTSRATLRLRWEHELAVPPLAVPQLAQPPRATEVADVPAVALFVERAQAVRPDFDLTDANAGAVAEICVRLDGLPLAIELAAARVKLFPPEVILARLEHRFDLLRGDAQDRPDRHQTLRAALDWSFLLLSASEQQLLAHLGVFVGGSSLEAIEALMDAPAEVGVASLLDKSLIRRDDASASEARVHMLETVRQYALEQLSARGELQQTQRQHAAWFLDLAEVAEPELNGPHQADWLARLAREHDNFRAALRWCIDTGEAELAARLGGALWRFWSVRGYPREGRVWLAEVRALGARSPDSGAQANVLAGAGRLAYDQADYAAARSLHEESLAMRRALGDARGVARSLGHLGDLAHQRGDYPAAQVLFEESLAALRAFDDAQGVAETLDKLGLTVRCRGDYAAAEALYEEALGISRSMGDAGREALVVNNLGRVAYYRGDLGRARALHEESLALRRAIGDRRGTATSLSDLADVAHQLGEYPLAQALRVESLAVWQELADPWGLAYVLESFAEQASVQEQPGTVVQLIAAATALRESLHAPRSPVSAQRMQRSLDIASRRLGRVSASETWAAGERLSLDEAAALALRLCSGSAPDVSVGPAAAALSPREREVAALITRGLTNRQIADHLVIGERTVHTHVANVLAKLELTSRTQIATWGVNQGLR